jgi:hypothetical protein
MDQQEQYIKGNRPDEFSVDEKFWRLLDELMDKAQHGR